jgi:hypothetical protein
MSALSTKLHSVTTHKTESKLYISCSIFTQEREKRKPKGTIVLVYATKVHGEVDIYLQSFLTSALDGVSGGLHVPAALSPEKGPPVQLHRRTVGPWWE